MPVFRFLRFVGGPFIFMLFACALAFAPSFSSFTASLRGGLYQSPSVYAWRIQVSPFAPHAPALVGGPVPHTVLPHIWPSSSFLHLLRVLIDSSSFSVFASELGFTARPNQSAFKYPPTCGSFSTYLLHVSLLSRG